MTTKEILTLKNQGKSEFEIFEILACNLGLYGFAFFGHKFLSKEENHRAKRVLQRNQNRINAIVLNLNQNGF